MFSSQNIFSKLIAVTLCLAMAFGETLWADEVFYSADQTAVLRPFYLPPELGSLDESSFSGAEKMIIYVQDAHDSLQAQENTARIINHLVEKEGVRTVFEEGYEGEVPTDKYFGGIQDPQVRRKISGFLMDQLRIGGAEYAHINRAVDFLLVGADSLHLHRENINAYLESSEGRSEVRTELGEMKSVLVTLAQKKFPAPLQEWMKIRDRFKTSELDLTEYLKRTERLIAASPEGSGLRPIYPQISLLLAAAGKEADEKTASLDARLLFREIQERETFYADSLLSEEKDRELFHHLEHLDLLRRLNETEISAAEYEEVKDSLRGSATTKLARFIAAQTGTSTVLSKRWETRIHSAVRFYEIAHERDLAIEEKLRSFAAGSEKKAILVFGGFHKDAIRDILKKKGFDYQIISPRITQIEDRHRGYYRELMSGAHHPFEMPALVAVSSRPLSAIERWDRDPRAAVTELAVMQDVARTITSEDPVLFGRAAEIRMRETGKGRFSKVRSELRTLEPAVFRLEEEFGPKNASVPVEQIVFVSDNTGTLVDNFGDPLTGKILKNLTKLLVNPGSYLVVNSGDPLKDLLDRTYPPLLETLSEEALSRVHIIADSAAKKAGFGENAYRLEMEAWPVNDRVQYARTLADYFYDQLLKRQGGMASMMEGVPDETIEKWRQENLAKIDRLAANGGWGIIPKGEGKFVFHLLPPDVERKTGPVFIYDVGPKVTLDMPILRKEKIVPLEFTREIWKRIQEKFGPNRPGFYTVPVVGAVDIAKTAKVEGVNEILGRHVFPSLDPAKPTLFVVIGDSSNDIPTYDVKIPEGMNAAVLRVFLSTDDGYAADLPESVLITKETNLQGMAQVLEYLTGIAGVPAEAAPPLEFLKWRVQSLPVSGEPGQSAGETMTAKAVELTKATGRELLELDEAALASEVIGQERSLKLITALREGKLVEIRFKTYADIMFLEHYIRSVGLFDEIGMILRERFGHPDDGFLMEGIRYPVKEMLKNALFHGNHYDFSKAIFLKLDFTKAGGVARIHVLDEAVSSPSPAWLVRQATERRLTGLGEFKLDAARSGWFYSQEKAAGVGTAVSLTRPQVGVDGSQRSELRTGIHEKITAAVESKARENMILTIEGGAGSGKNFVASLIQESGTGPFKTEEISIIDLDDFLPRQIEEDGVVYLEDPESGKRVLFFDEEDPEAGHRMVEEGRFDDFMKYAEFREKLAEEREKSKLVIIVGLYVPLFLVREGFSPDVRIKLLTDPVKARLRAILRDGNLDRYFESFFAEEHVNSLASDVPVDLSLNNDGFVIGSAPAGLESHSEVSIADTSIYGFLVSEKSYGVSMGKNFETFADILENEARLAGLGDPPAAGSPNLSGTEAFLAAVYDLLIDVLSMQTQPASVTVKRFEKGLEVVLKGLDEGVPMLDDQDTPLGEAVYRVPEFLASGGGIAYVRTYHSRWEESWIPAKGSVLVLAMPSAKQEAPLVVRTMGEFRSEIRLDDRRQGTAIEALAAPVGVFLDAGELARLGEDDRDGQLDELLAFLLRHHAFDLYLDGTDRYPLASIRNKKFQKLLSENSARVHIGLHDRAHLSKKQILIQAFLFENGDGSEKTEQILRELKTKYRIEAEIFPLEYTRPGELGAFVDLAESFMEAALLGRVSDIYAVRGPNGRWKVSPDFAASVWNQLMASYAIEWSA